MLRESFQASYPVYVGIVIGFAPWQFQETVRISSSMIFGPYFHTLGPSWSSHEPQSLFKNMIIKERMANLENKIPPIDSKQTPERLRHSL